MPGRRRISRTGQHMCMYNDGLRGFRPWLWDNRGMAAVSRAGMAVRRTSRVDKKDELLVEDCVELRHGQPTACQALAEEVVVLLRVALLGDG